MVSGSLEMVVAALDGKRESGQYRCRCPVHGGSSLMVKQGRERVLLACMAGCDTADVIDALRDMGLWAQAPRRPGPPTGYELEQARLAVVREVFLRNLDAAAGAEPRPRSKALDRAADLLRRSSDRDDWILARIAGGERHARAA